MPVDGFSVRWRGWVTAPISGTYTFAMTTDDGVRLWIDGQQLIDEWIVQGPTTYIGPSSSPRASHTRL
jgi:hypothetical protein